MNPVNHNIDEPLTTSGIQLDRRSLILSAGAATLTVIGLSWARNAFRQKQPVFLAANQKYDGALVQTIRDGLLSTGIESEKLRGKKVLLKPNMVEPNRASPQMTTHPAMVRAAAEVFRKWGATVTVGEGPGHVRDTEMALVESGIEEALTSDKIEFADLNYEEVGWVENRGKTSILKGFHFPRSVMEADLVVSMPKLKTHHWVGMTASLKNLYGLLPGCVYGWPKNVLHHAGIPQTVVDINASLPKTVTIVDGIVCMEGDGPIMGTPKDLGLVAIGSNLAAVDATCARVMGLEPTRISYLELGAGKLGPINERLIPQHGEHWQSLYSPFQMIDEPHLRGLRAEVSGG